MEQPKVFQKSPIVKDEKSGTYYWCACGQSKNQPYCDGTHKGTTFSPMKVEVADNLSVLVVTVGIGDLFEIYRTIFDL